LGVSAEISQNSDAPGLDGVASPGSLMVDGENGMFILLILEPSIFQYLIAIKSATTYALPGGFQWIMCLFSFFLAG